MSREYFQTWGLELSDDDFACALAAYGVLHHHELIYLLEHQENLEAELESWLMKSFRFLSKGEEDRWPRVRWAPARRRTRRASFRAPARCFAFRRPTAPSS